MFACVTANASLRLLLLLLLLGLLRLRSGRRRAVCCFLFSPSFLAPNFFLLLCLLLCLFGKALGSLRPRHCLEPVRLLFWLLARLVDGLAPSACAVRCSHGSTMRFSTMSCVYSTHRSLHALNFPSWLQRISLAFVTSFASWCPSWASTSLSSSCSS